MERAYYYVENYEPEPEATDDTVVYEAKPDVEIRYHSWWTMLAF